MSERQPLDPRPPASSSAWREDTPDDGLVGRASELRLLEERITALRSGRPGVVTVTGRPGTGRTALLRKTVALAKAAGVRSLLLQCSHGDAESPYTLVSQFTAAALSAGFTIPSGFAPSAGVADAELIPRLCAAFLAIVRERPTVIAIDDAQWTDPRSRRWLGAVARRFRSTPVLLVCAVRGAAGGYSAGDGSWPIADDRTVPSWVLELNPLDATGVRDVIAAGYSGPVESEFSAYALTTTGGIPAVLKATLGRFALTGLPPAAEHLSALALRAAEALSQYVDDIVQDLPPGAVGVLRAMAVVNGGLDFDAVLALAGSRTTPPSRVLGPLVGAGLVLAAGEPRVATAAIAAKVLAGMPSSTREDLYARAAEAGHLAAISDAELGRFLLGAPPVGRAWAVGVLHRAAALHRAEKRHSMATSLLERALREPLTQSRRRRLLVELAAAEVRSSPEGSDRRLHRMLLSADAGHEVPLLVRAADLLLTRGDAPGVRRVLATVCARPGFDPADLAPLVALGRLADHASADEQEFPVASLPSLPDLPTEPAQAAVVAWRLACRGRGRSRAKALARAALDRRPGRQGPLATRIAAAMALMYTDDTIEAMAGFDGVLADARRQDARAAAGQALLNRAGLALRTGRLNEASDDLAAIKAQLPLNCWSPRALPGLLAVEVTLHLERGLLDRAEHAAAVDLPPDAENGIGWAHLLCARGMMNLAGDKPRAALRQFQECGRVLLNMQCVNPAVSSWRVLAATAAMRCGNSRPAFRLVHEELNLAKEWGSPTGLGTTHLGAWEALRPALGTHELEEAVRLLRDSPARLRYATAAIELAAVKLDADEFDQASALLRDAQGEASLPLSGNLLSRLRSLSGHLAVKRNLPELRTPFRHEGELSVEERKLAMMVASGRSNAEIAASLSVSARTVKLRLTKIYRKLGVTGRTGLFSAFGQYSMER